MANFLYDTFTGVDGTAINSHTGETGATWTTDPWHNRGGLVLTNANRVRNSDDDVSLASGNYASGVPTSADYSVTETVRAVALSGWPGYVGVFGRRNLAGFEFAAYWVIYYPTDGKWHLYKNSTELGTYTQALVDGTDYQLTLDMAGTTIRVLIDGVERINVTDSTYAAAGKAGIIAYRSATNSTGMHIGDVAAAGASPSLTNPANDPDFHYYGRWKSGATAITINNGSECRFAYTGNSLNLLFDVSTVTGGNYPAIAYWVDNVGPTRAALDAAGVVAITPVHNTISAGRHFVRFMANIESGFPVAVDNWASQTDALKFSGASLAAGEDLLTIPENPSTIEFLGDSITAGLRLLYAGTDGTAVNAPEINWPEYVSQMLGLVTLVNGHGGQSLAGAGTDGTPAANAAFPYVYSGQAWNPTDKPIAVVIYQGTNATATQAQYAAYLATIRAAYPKAVVFAVNPYNVNNFTQISAAVAAAGSRMYALNYQTALASTDLASDGIHLNPSGAVKLATLLASDIQSRFDTLGVGFGDAFAITVNATVGP